MSSTLGVQVRWQLDVSQLNVDRAVPKFVLPTRLEQFAPSPSVSMAPSVRHQAERTRSGLARRVGDLWGQHRARCPDLWSFVSWAQAEQASTPDTRELSAVDYAARMRTGRDLREIEEEVEAPDSGADSGIGSEEGREEGA